MAENWRCPFCDRDQVLTEGQVSVDKHVAPGIRHGVHIVTRACANPECGEFEVTAFFGPGRYGPSGWDLQQVRETFLLRPANRAKPKRDYVPDPIYRDYFEACSIVALSPKAAATLVRRCLQGMIRDFCAITKATLAKEIEALRDEVQKGNAAGGVTAESVDAIDAVRAVGNIGAHMEGDINLVIEVEPEEATALIGLVEMLFEDWYGNRSRRSARLAQLQAIAGQKRLAKATPAAALPAPAPATP